ncbi:hypothetical protein ACEPAH_8009 [Sanghuangporus vaninii]
MRSVPSSTRVFLTMLRVHLFAFPFLFLLSGVLSVPVRYATPPAAGHLISRDIVSRDGDSSHSDNDGQNEGSDSLLGDVGNAVGNVVEHPEELWGGGRGGSELNCDQYMRKGC